MTASHTEHHLSPAKGRSRFAAIGYVVRAMKSLPAPLRERLLDVFTSGVSSSLPPFPDVLRLVEAAGGIPDGKLWQERLLADRPELRAVRIRNISDDERGRVRARLYLPSKGAAMPPAALVWVHGGAFVLGSLDAKEAHWLAMELAGSGLPVLSLDYRMCIADVHYPLPLEDVLSGWDWAIAHCSELGVDPSQLHLGGASAGGCLVASACLRLRALGKPLPASQILAYPVLEGSLPPASAKMAIELAGANLPPDGWIADMFSNWAGAASQDDSLVTPARGDPAGLPPTYVLTCGHDALRRSSEPYVRRLENAGVAVWQDILQEAEHAPLDRPGTPDGVEAVARIRTWLSAGIEGMAS